MTDVVGASPKDKFTVTVRHWNATVIAFRTKAGDCELAEGDKLLRYRRMGREMQLRGHVHMACAEVCPVAAASARWRECFSLLRHCRP